MVREGKVRVAAGVELAVRDRPSIATAQDPAFLLVHGLASNARMWDGVGARLADRGHRAVAVDLRGHGRSDRPERGYDPATIVADLERVIAELALATPIAVGQSWGGNVVLKVAVTRGPALLRGVACLDGGFIDLPSEFTDWEDCKHALEPPNLDGIPQADLEAMMRRSHADWPPEGIAGALANFKERPDGTTRPRLARAHHLTILRTMWDDPPARWYQDIDVPVLLLPVGGSDRKGRQVAAAEAGLPNSRTVWSDGHHDLHAQRPDAVVELLLGALADGFFEPTP